jgi:hypothetical protein
MLVMQDMEKYMFRSSRSLSGFIYELCTSLSTEGYANMCTGLEPVILLDT